MSNNSIIIILICIVAWVIIISFMLRTYGRLIIDTLLGKEE